MNLIEITAIYLEISLAGLQFLPLKNIHRPAVLELCIEISG
jgi:hypothetical protein